LAITTTIPMSFPGARVERSSNTRVKNGYRRDQVRARCDPTRRRGRSVSPTWIDAVRTRWRRFQETFRLALLEKDIGIAAVMANDMDARTPAFNSRRRFHEARELLGDEADHVEAVKMVEQENGIEIK